MNAIVIDGITYNEVEIQRFINDSKTSNERAEKFVDKLYNVKRQLRDFFADQDWDSREVTINKSSVNGLLEELECDKLTTKYEGTYTITGTFNIEASDEDEAQCIISDESEVSNYGAKMSIDQIETFDIEENE